MTKKLDLLLIHPGTNRRVYEGLADKYAAKEPPFMAAVVADAVRRNGYNVKIIDANVYDLSHEEVANRVIDINPRLIATLVHGHQPSASSQMMGAVGEMCQEIKGRTDIPILLGGVHPSSIPERTLKEEACNFVARGEEHPAILGLLEGALESKEYSKVPGLYYLDNGNVLMNNAPPLADLNKGLPTAAWDLLPPLKNYRAHNWHAYFAEPEERSPYGSLYTSLGCPFNCDFCMIHGSFKLNLGDKKRPLTIASRVSESEIQNDINNVRPTIRYWNTENVLKNLDYFAEQGVKHVKFIDEMFVLDNKYINELADKMIERDYSFNIWAYARIDTVEDRPLLSKLKKAGINWLALGIESANKAVRYGADKKFCNEDIIKNVRKVEDAGIDVLGNYMLGLRTDTHESMRETVDMAKELNTLWFNIYATMAYPGARNYAWAKENKIQLPGDLGVPGGWTAYSHHSYYSLPLATETLPASEVLRERDDAFHEYFSNPVYHDLIRKRFGEKEVDHIKKMASKRIARRILGDPKPANVN